ncbi:major facilitator superfamily domain-containing protein [Chaetomium strumarium]|uniref:Major facilitator superfamily domain-containing protein n=1 Tax=Chaetomium strumarium TaxID=1170767 RepID=A0AAJ0M3J7_9PEZI|nr:major facilitator superfamily domain-containing protein [Chaetomium strumarium]
MSKEGRRHTIFVFDGRVGAATESKEHLTDIPLHKAWSAKSESESVQLHDGNAGLVVGTSQLYDEYNQRRYIPTPTPDPNDPLNLRPWRKWAAVASLCFFGALALAAEAIIAALVPVFALEYAGINPQVLSVIDLSQLQPEGAVDVNPLRSLSALGGPPLYRVALLSSLPLLVNGLASYLLVPLSIAVGRRPVLLFAGAAAWVGGLWGGLSTSLESHLAARCLQGLGAGAVEALIPLIVQDMMFIHERNRAIACIGASQGLIIVGLGIASPLLVVRLSWRYIYYITTAAAALAFLLTVLLVPETRWTRSPDELAGKAVYPLEPGETRPRLDVKTYGLRTRATDFGVFRHVPRQWRLAGVSVYHTARSTLFPIVLWVIVVNSILVSLQGAAGQVGSAVLIAAGWKFETMGFAVVPLVVASPFVWFFAGWVADRVSNGYAKRNGGRREPEAHLLSLAVPLLAAIVGSAVFGYAGENIKTVPSIVLLVGVFLVGFGFLAANTLFSVYVVESYPSIAGPVLVNVSSFRLIIGFTMSFNATTWVEQLGFQRSFGFYSLALAVASLGLPVVFAFGKRLRAWTALRI